MYTSSHSLMCRSTLSAQSPRTISYLSPVSKPPHQRARGLTGLSISLQPLTVQPIKKEDEITDAEC